ncbi:L-2-amino-thiazoline-4-carboxylic acid hydrolase [bacterium]|nr:L-2-amino-thiazoline-4-carboxylic acid hydrolase [bacterium]
MKSQHDDTTHKHWEKREEKNWKQFQFNQPYSKGLTRLNDQVLAKTNFDPATLWQWGTMQAMAVIDILKSVEKHFGQEGQQIINKSLTRVGYDIGRQVTEGTTIPKEMTNAEWTSFYATVINRIAYASLETARIRDEKDADFHIDWCPHQDHYQAMDCRVQRYFVQGMIDAAMDFVKSQGREDIWDVAFRTTIPSGEETCFFQIQHGDPEQARKWAEYTEFIEKKALEIAKKENN